MINEYVKKPVKITAVQWDGKNIDEIMKFLGWRNADHDERNGLVIRTLEGNHNANIGDFIIMGVAGEFYPCDNDIFKATYYTQDEYAAL